MESFTQLDPATLTVDDLARGRDQALAQIAWVRDYSLQLIESIPDDLWYVRPAGSVSHVAWQVGHLAVSQYGLMLFRQRGRSPGDLDLMPGWLRKQFGRGTLPSTTADSMPSPAELLDRLSKIHAQSLAEVRELPVESLVEPIDMPYTAYPIKLGALLFAPIHESLHAGQIGLLRRLHGLEPIR
ncbi:MAG: DinB family protein [Pirellulaceae bacterium]